MSIACKANIFVTENAEKVNKTEKPTYLFHNTNAGYY